MKKHVHVGWPIGVAVAAVVVITAAVAIDVHDRSQKESWALHWESTHARFERHIQCMRDPKCDSMKILPQAD